MHIAQPENYGEKLIKWQVTREIGIWVAW